MINIHRRAVLLLTSSFTQPIPHTESSAVADDFSNLVGSISADVLFGGLWDPDTIEQKMKLCSGDEHNPEDRVRSLLYKKYIEPVRTAVCLGLAFEAI